jgi:hypothetical protein
MASQKMSNWRPKASKRKGLLVEEVRGEVLVYNLKGHRVHCLNDPAARIWNLCDGRRTLKQIAEGLESDLDPATRELVVRNAVAQFSRLGLVAANDEAPADMSRRELARKIGIGAAATVALPLIISIIAPTPAHAATNIANGNPCTLSADCQSGCCCANATLRNTCQANAGVCSGAGCKTS